MSTTTRRVPKFNPGQCLATPGALAALEESQETPSTFLDRHCRGDWGDLSDQDRLANTQALFDGSRILSAYRTFLNVKIWIISEAVGENGLRSATTILLPSEY